VKFSGVSNDPDDIRNAGNSFHADPADCPRIIRCACLSAASFFAKICLYFLWNSGRVLLQKGEASQVLRLQNDGGKKEVEGV
jgi:hypothetical protein